VVNYLTAHEFVAESNHVEPVPVHDWIKKTFTCAIKTLQSPLFLLRLIKYTSPFKKSAN